MSRPEQVSDLHDYEIAPHEVSTVFIDRFQENGDMLVAYGQFVNAAKAAGFTINGTQITHDRTDEELAKKLKSAQDSWDYQQQQYTDALNGGERPKHDYGLRQWCEREGLHYPFDDVAAGAEGLR
ncbi:hypothetical protein P3H15_27450 [Rhodococcus sp. T2V]|uniref:DUF7432 family protein n=1 Tax=Rhodococcus sp. T2V TaxID=3034164 RepID=UPI0023E1C7D2|nr:hypothetical protein [Rhodococcus sp. T2V]MDF3308759.1 hypothetical protein [Rhodococcus sp. T2V]